MVKYLNWLQATSWLIDKHGKGVELSTPFPLSISDLRRVSQKTQKLFRLKGKY